MTMRRVAGQCGCPWCELLVQGQDELCRIRWSQTFGSAAGDPARLADLQQQWRDLLAERQALAMQALAQIKTEQQVVRR